MPVEDNATVTIEDARLIFTNFEGKEAMYNTKGERNFGLLLPEPLASQMAEDGWAVKTLKGRDEEGNEDPEVTGDPWISVNVKFAVKPPHVVLIASGPRTKLDEKNIDILDHMDIETVDVVIRAYNWTVNGKSGTKAYLKTMFVTIKEDDLERKYGPT